jgi:hypothetical protein
MVGDTPWDRHLNHYQKRAIALVGAVDYGFDVGALADPKLVTPTIASTLGLTTQTEDVLPTLTECLWTLVLSVDTAIARGVAFWIGSA